MATSLLKFSFKTGLIKSIISEIASNISKYYYVFGKADPWFTISGLTATLAAGSSIVTVTNGNTTGFIKGQLVTQTGGSGTFGSEARVDTIVSDTQFTVTENHVDSGNVVFNIDDESIVDQVIDSYEYEVGVRNNAILYKQIDSNDVAPVIFRLNWTSGFVYDMYREYTETDPSYNGATSIESATFYVLTDQYQVYKCLDNNNNSPSQNKPTGTSNVAFATDDQYIWKYMYTIPITLRNKFLSTTLMPVTTALTTQFYSRGSIVGYSIENPGSGYTNASYKVTGFRILSGGVLYTGTPSITIEAPHQTAGAQAVVGTIVLTGGVITSILMSSEGSGYSYPPLFSLVGDASTEAIIEPIVENTGFALTDLIVDGDGYLEENPYVIERIDIINGGIGYDTIDLEFTDPDLPNGIRSAATVEFDVNGTVTAITLNQEGYGYSNQFYSVMDDPQASNVVRYNQTNLGIEPGTGFIFRVITKKNNAELAAIINIDGQIEQVKVIKAGIGYTYASVNIVTDLDTPEQEGFEPASILLDFGVGSIESNQSTVEITAVPGAIEAIHIKTELIDNEIVRYGGTGYGDVPIVEISGDGVGAEAEAILDVFGSISKIKINNPGYGYTVASATVIGFATEDAILDVILPPKDGHGSDAISELYAKTIMFRTALFKDRIFKQPIDNSFRQVCLVKNPKIFNSKSNLRLGIASSSILAIGSSSQNTEFNKIYPNDIVTSDGNEFLVVAKYPNYDANNHAILLNYLSNSVISAGANLAKLVDGLGANFSINSVILPNANKFSGQVLTIDNRVKFSPTGDQIVIASNTITF